MQFGKFEIQIGGEMTNTVVRDGISPAEYLVMQVLHGDHSLTPIAITGEKPVQTSQEMERLRFRFQSKNAANALNQVFPGARPVNVPVNFADIGLHDIPHAEDAVVETLEKTGMSQEDAAAVIAATNKKAAEEEAAAEAAKKKQKEEVEAAEAAKEEAEKKAKEEAEEKAAADAKEKEAKKSSSKKSGKSSKKADEDKTQFEEEVEIQYND